MSQGEPGGTNSKKATCYYFHGQDFCIVPRHVREDMTWMSDHGVDAIAVAVHEGDLRGSNLPLVCEEAHRAHLEVLAVPSRIGGLTAGWHRAPGFLASLHPEFWARDAQGAPVLSVGLGPQCSVYHPAVLEGICAFLDSLLDQLPVRGIIWDELKCLEIEDHCDAALRALGRSSGGAAQVEGTCEFFDRVNQHIRGRAAGTRIDLFVPAHLPDPIIGRVAQIHGLDAFGCDGKCWPAGASEVGEGGALKHLIGNIGRFECACRASGCGLLVLIETQMLDVPSLDLTVRHLPNCLAHDIGHLIYYYYPRLMALPDQYMPRLGDAIGAWRHGAASTAATFEEPAALRGRG